MSSPEQAASKYALDFDTVRTIIKKDAKFSIPEKVVKKMDMHNLCWTPIPEISKTPRFIYLFGSRNENSFSERPTVVMELEQVKKSQKMETVVFRIKDLKKNETVFKKLKKCSLAPPRNEDISIY